MKAIRSSVRRPLMVVSLPQIAARQPDSQDDLLDDEEEFEVDHDRNDGGSARWIGGGKIP